MSKVPDADLWPHPNPNLEIRNSKQIQNTNAPMFKTETKQLTVLVI
jgi:hypothetical protein